MNIRIRRAFSSDLSELKSFFTLMIRDTYEREGLGHLDDFINDEIESKICLFNTHVSSEGRDHFFLVAEHANNIIGTIAIGECGSHAVKVSHGESEKYLEIGSVFVHPSYQRKGIGKLLFKNILMVLLGRNQTTYCLDSGYTRAQKVWTNLLGPSQYTSLNYWGEGFDHKVWIKDIKDFDLTYESKKSLS